MRFRRYGKTYQLRIENADDLAAALGLDESLWVATSAPIDSLRCDSGFTKYVNADGSGRINTAEIKAAVAWLLDVLQDTSGLGSDADTIDLSAINPSSDYAADLLHSARHVLTCLGAEGTEAISLAQVRLYLDTEREQPLNGDGIIVPDAAGSVELQEYIAYAVDCTGGSEDASGKRGISLDQLNQFVGDVEGYTAWLAEGRSAEGDEQSLLFPFGTETAAVHDVYAEHAADVDHFFDLCRTLAFEPRAISGMHCSDAELAELNFLVPGDVETCLKQAPLAKPASGSALPLVGPDVNPLARAWMARFVREVLPRAKVDAGDVLSESDWEKTKSVLRPYDTYVRRRRGERVAKLPPEKLEAYLNASLRDQVHELIRKDEEIAAKLAGIRQVEKLLLYHQNLLRLANNFVSFSQLYAIDERGLFEMGSAVIDGRWLNLAVRVDDIEKHAKAAADSGIFTIYLDVVGRSGARSFTVAMPATSGAKGNLTVGKRGVFFDIDDREYDAHIVRIISNPISIREALCSPFVRLWGFVLGKIESMSGASEKDLQKSADQLLAAPPAARGAAGMPGGPAGLLVGLSVSAAAVGSSFAFITKTFSNLLPRQALMGLLGAAVCVGIPVALTAIMKLRNQDVSALLEGSGWAINARMRLSRGQRRQFTRKPGYPSGAKGIPRHRRLKLAILITLLHLLFLALAFQYQNGRINRVDATTPDSTTIGKVNTQ